MAANDDFVHKCMITIKAATRTHRAEKINLFAAILANGCSETISTDHFEECLQIVEDLSLRELVALRTLEEFEIANPIQSGQSNLQRASLFWPQYLEKIEEIIYIRSDETPSFIKRIERTGCYLEISGAYWDYTGGKGYTTEKYQQIKCICKSKMN
jgi:hypothetical protein